MARLQPPDYAAHVARMDAERARQHLAAWAAEGPTPVCRCGHRLARHDRAFACTACDCELYRGEQR